jgi:hypothetical protein
MPSTWTYARDLHATRTEEQRVAICRENSYLLDVLADIAMMLRGEVPANHPAPVPCASCDFTSVVELVRAKLVAQSAPTDRAPATPPTSSDLWGSHMGDGLRRCLARSPGSSMPSFARAALKSGQWYDLSECRRTTDEPINARHSGQLRGQVE